MANDARLLRTQKNELVPLLENAGFGVDDFKWECDNSFQEKREWGFRMGERTYRTETLLVSVLVHKNSGYYCKFGREIMVISPGEHELIRTIYPKTHEAGLQDWIRYL